MPARWATTAGLVCSVVGSASQMQWVKTSGPTKAGIGSVHARTHVLKTHGASAGGRGQGQWRAR